MGTATSSLFNQAGVAFNVDPRLLSSVATVESGNRTFDQQGRLITSPAGAQGVMQFMPETARQYNVDVADPASSVYGAAAYLHDLLQRTKGDVPAALQIYNGALGDQGQTYTRQILAAYHATPAATPVAASIDVGPSYSPAAPPGQPGSETYTPPPGSQEGREGGVSLTVRPAAASPTQKYAGIFGPKPPPPTQAAGAPSEAATKYPGIFGAAPPGAPEAAPAPGVPVAGPAAPAAAPAPAVAPSAPPAIPAPQFVSPAEAAPPPAAPIPPPVAAPTATPPARIPTAPGWMPQTIVRNVYNPISAMVQPNAPAPPRNYLMGVPLLQEAGAGLMQSGRNVEQTLNQLGNWAGARLAPNVPVPPDIAASEAETAAETAAYRRQYGSDRPAQVSENIGNVLLTAPLLRPFEAAAEGYTAAAPFLQGAGRLARFGRFALPRAAAGAIAGGGTDLLTAGGTGMDPTGGIGALGGAALNVALPGAGALLRGGREAVTTVADRLGIPLSLGQIKGGTYQRLEQLSRLIPFSGATKLAARQREAIADFFRREMRVGGEGHFTGTDLAGFLGRTGTRMQNAARRMTLRADRATTRELFDLYNDATRYDDPLGRVPDLPVSRDAKRLWHIMETTARRNGGAIPGQEFLNLIKKGGDVDRLVGASDSNVSRFGKRLRGILFRAMERSPGNNPADVREFKDSRYAYKVGKTIERAVGHGLTGTEEIRLPGLAADIRRSFRRFDASGLRPIQQLAGLIGSTPDVGTSGTAENLLLAHPILSALGVGGGAAALHEIDPRRFDEYVSRYGPELAGVLAGIRASRFGGTMGSRILEQAQEAGRPLLPRFLGYWAGQRLRNNLITPPNVAQRGQ